MGFLPMNDLTILACPMCARTLALTAQAERFACPYCSREHLVSRSDGGVDLIPVVKELDGLAGSVGGRELVPMNRLRLGQECIEESIHECEGRLRRLEAGRLRTRFWAQATLLLSALCMVGAVATWGQNGPADLFLSLAVLSIGVLPAGLMGLVIASCHDRPLRKARLKLGSLRSRRDLMGVPVEPFAAVPG
jgi:hypothetical protein